jgi:hypothetical protein
MPEVSERSGSFSILKSLKSSLDFVRYRFAHTPIYATRSSYSLKQEEARRRESSEEERREKRGKEEKEAAKG